MKKMLVFCALLLSSFASAQTFEWSGSGDGVSWEDSLNWIGGTPPGGNINHDVIIDGANGVKINSSFVIGTLRLKSSRLTIDNTYTLSVIHSSAAPGDTLSAVEFVQSEVDVKGKLYISSSDRNFALSLRRTDMFVYASAVVDIAASIYGLAVYNNGDLDLKTGSLLEIDADSLAIQNNQSIENNGKIEIDADIDGIINNGNFSSSDTLIIDGYGISMLTAIENNGVFINEGYLDINNVNLYGIYNTGILTNTTGAYLKIYDITPSALGGSSAVYSSGSFVNDGEIYALVRTEFGVFNEENTAGFVNSGTALFTGADSLEFANIGSVSDSSLLVNTGTLDLNVGCDVLLNNSYGKVLWSGTGLLAGKDGIINEGRFELNGDSLTFDVSETAIKNYDYFHSNGHIHLEDCKNGIDNQGEFYNLSTGEILITATNGSASSFGFKNTQEFVNEGNVEVNNAVFGIKNETDGDTFTNNGDIWIKQSSTAFILNNGIGTDSSYFINNGKMLLEQSVSSGLGNTIGIWNQGKGSFKSDGTIGMNTMWQNTENIKNEGYFFFNDSLNIKETREVNINNLGSFVSGNEAFLNLDFSQNFGEYVVQNSGEMTLNGRTDMVYFDTYQRNIPLFNNESIFNNKGYFRIEGSGEAEGILNTGTFINEDTLVLNKVRNIGIENSGTFINSVGALFQSDSLLNSISAGTLFQNDGSMLLNGETSILISDNSTLTNSGLLKMKNGISDAIWLEGLNPVLVNQAGGEILIDSSEVSSILDSDGIRMESGQLTNDGLIRLNHISDAGIRMIGGTLTNNDSLWVKSFKGMHGVWVENSSFINNGYLDLDGAEESSVGLMNVLSSGSLENTGEILLRDAHTRGIYNLGLFTSTLGSNIHFENNTRNTSALLYHSNVSNPTTYNGNMTSVNSKSCVSFSGAAINNGHLDLRGCGSLAFIMTSGTNSTNGQILLDHDSFVGTNEGILEYFSDSVSSISGTNTMINLGVIIDHGNQFRNTKFNDGDALGFPIWNKGLFASPFYGNISEDIRENININYTEPGSLPISNDWYVDRAMATSAGVWHQTDHYFTPNANANAADSLFLEVNLSGSNPIVLGVPHKQISVCPQPIVTKILRPKVDYNWNDHTTWRGNRAPDYCDKVVLSGFNDVYVPSLYKAKLNTLEFEPQAGQSSFLEFQYGSVMEVNVIPYE